MSLWCWSKRTGISLWLLCGSSGLMAGTPDVTHHQAQQDCHSCHTERLPVIQPSGKCQACHDEIKSLNRKGGPAQGKLKALSEFDVDQPPSSMEASTKVYFPNHRMTADPGPMARIPAGAFIMGSDARLEDEGPEHQAQTALYRIDLYEVTNLQYRKFISATQRRSPGHFRNRSFTEGYADHPVVFVSWFDAQAYCGWAGKRLPTEIEWEKAARGEKGRIYPWGDEFRIQAANTPMRWQVLAKNSASKEAVGFKGDTTPVGSFVAGRSPYGLYDMSGNVWEWVADWYQPHPGNKGISENYGQINKVLKGGSWWDCSFYKCGISAPTFNRSFFNPRVRNASFGFRCAMDDSHHQAEP